jgi:hypothetical protein
VVMYLNGKSEINLHYTNLWKKQDTDRHGTAIGAKQDINSPRKKERYY